MNIFCVSDRDLDRLEIGTYVTNSFDVALERAVDILGAGTVQHVYIHWAEVDFDDVAWDRESMLEQLDGWMGQLMLPAPLSETLKVGRDGVGEWSRKT